MFKKVVKLLIVFTVLLTINSCKKEEKKVVIASKPMTEQYIIVEMLTKLIETKTDITVVQKMGIGGGTSNIHPGMISGEIDIYPEYTGTGWMFVLKQDLISDPMKLYSSVKKMYKDEYNIVWTGLYGFNDTYGIALKEELAKQLNILNYSDLAANSGNLSFGAEYDFYEREDGYPGLSEKYGFDFGKKTELDIGLKYQAISSDEVDVINVFSTDGRLKENRLVVLEDNMNFFPSYYAATLIREEILTKFPELKPVLEILTDKISNNEMIHMNYLVEIEKMDPKVVASDFLRNKGLI